MPDQASDGRGRKSRFNYDERCWDLALYFLSDEPHEYMHIQKLAQTIQDAIEDWLREKCEAGR